MLGQTPAPEPAYPVDSYFLSDLERILLFFLKLSQTLRTMSFIFLCPVFSSMLCKEGFLWISNLSSFPTQNFQWLPNGALISLSPLTTHPPLSSQSFLLKYSWQKEVINKDLTGYFQNPICKHNPSLPGLLGKCTMTNYALTTH